MAHAKVRPYTIELWTPQHDAMAFSSGMASIDRYIKNQAAREMVNHVSLVFVLTEGNNVIRAYYSLSGISVIFAELPEKVQKKLPSYPQMSATLLGRLGVDRNYSAELQNRLGEKPRLGEFLLVDAQKKTLQGAMTTSGAALMVVDAERPTDEELAAGIRDPITFYPDYGFAPLSSNERRFFKLTRVIESEFAEAGLQLDQSAKAVIPPEPAKPETPKTE